MSRKARWLLIGGLWALVLLTGIDRGWTMGTEEVVAKVQKVYEETRTFKAAFVQETFVRSAKKTIREEGWVYYKRPGLMRWDYRRPKEKRMILSPTKTWLYIPQDKVAYVREGRGGVMSHAVGRFLAGIGRITDDFIVSSAPGEGVYRLVLQPRETSPAVKALKITVDPDSYLVTSCRYTDDYGNEVAIIFSQLELNVPLQDALFRFRPPLV